MGSKSVLFERLLKQRGVDEDFLNPRYEKIAAPEFLPDLQRAVQRMVKGIERGEKIVVYGDYDVDGVCASTVMKEALENAGARGVEVLLPDRFGEGYGMNEGAVKQILDLGASLVVTVDCGSGSGLVIEELKKAGVDTIVTDHHEVLNLPEAAVAVVNPKRKDWEDEDVHGLRNLAGVGVAFNVARALNAWKNGGTCDGQEKWYLDLVAVGTICDSMLILRDNRSLVYWGLKVLAKTRRAGLIELMKLAGIRAENVSAESIGFQLGPRLNAGGRMESAYVALDLLLTTKRAEAAKLASRLEELNKKRRQVQDEAVKEISERSCEDNSHVLVVQGAWHEGVIGIIAGRLVEQYKRPSIVLTEVDDGFLKGSGRSFGEFSLADCMAECQDLLVKGGGHDFACGLMIAEDMVDEFRQRVNKYYDGLGLKNQERFLAVASDLDLDGFGDLNEELCDDLARLEPYGEGNNEPVFVARARVFMVRNMKDKHLSLTLRDKAGRFFRLVAFYVPEKWFEIVEGDEVEAKFNVGVNEWQGRRSVEGRLLELKKMLEDDDELW